jgi:Tfp pilus assembly PilM family ATPase
VFILNIGSERTTVAILSEEGRPFVRDMTYAGNTIIELIASENECSVEDVRRVLIGGTAEDLSQFGDSLRRSCRRIADDVRSTSRFHKSQHYTGEFECVHVCGGFALVDGFVETLNEELPIEAKIWNPFEKVRLDPKRKRNESEAEDILRSKGPAMAVAAGLALRTV